MIYGIDVSRWQPSVDWALLKSKGVEFVIIKATQGNYAVDSMLSKHVEGAKKAGMIIGLYHWADPLVDANAQAKYFVNAIKNLPFNLVAVDVEQYWADWKEWSNGSIKKNISPTVISDNARTILEYWKNNLKTTRILYSRASFIHGFARPMLTWVGGVHLWMAHYPYNSTRVRTTWEDFKANYKPSIAGPNLPSGATTWKFWQFTGDKFVLPGVTTALDVNYFNGNLNDLRKFVGLDNVVEPELTVKERVAKLEAEARARGWNV